MFKTEIEEKLENENLERCLNCEKFENCLVSDKKSVIECEEFDEIDF